MEGAALSAEGIVAGYRDLDILNGCTVHVREREVVCIIGPNGAGKSTLLKAIFGLVRTREGRVRLHGQDVTGLASQDLVSRGLAYVPQVGNVFPSLTVDENLAMGAYLHPDREERARDRVRALFPVLADRAGQRVGKMSGGERQMVAVARALMSEPRVLLLDEPTAGLAPRVQDEVLAQVRAIADAGTPILLVEQNAKKGLAMSDRAYVLEQGRNKYEGTGPELLADPNVGRLYLGDG